MTRFSVIAATVLAVMTLGAMTLAVGPARAVDDALSIEANQAFLAVNTKKPGWVTRPSGLQFRIVQNGYGKRPAPSDTVTVYYTGTLINHVIFDGTSPGLPASFKVVNVIPGWSEALQLMREGDHWLICIPPNLGYGVRGSPGGQIPPNQALMFDVKLIKTEPPPKKGEKGYVPEPGDTDDAQ